MNFCHSREIYPTKTRKTMDTATKTELDAIKTACKKIVHKAA